MMQRKHIQVFGTVQGVGFRHHTELIAKNLIYLVLFKMLRIM